METGLRIATEFDPLLMAVLWLNRILSVERSKTKGGMKAAN